MAEALLEGEAEALVRKGIELALKGDVGCLRLCLDRICPPPRSRVVNFTLPDLGDGGAEGLMAAHTALLKAVAGGKLAPDEGAQISAMIAAHLKTIEVADHADRIRVLEKQVGVRK